MNDINPMSELSWLELDVPADHARYSSEWKNTASRRPHDHPGYLSLMRPANYSPAAVVYSPSESARMIYPFYYCRLKEIPAFKDYHKDVIHLVSPYGYGGPMYEGASACYRDVTNKFEALFKGQLESRSCVSEFVREDIFVERLGARSSGELLEQQKNVVVRLERSSENIWRAYKPKVRKNVNRARESGLKVIFDKDGEHIDEFVNVYHETMRRTSASSSFFISRERFLSLNSTLGLDGGLMYVHVLDGERIVSTELLLLSKDSIYSFLGGTLPDAFEKRPNDLLKHAVIEWGAKNGFKWYVLGGGVTPGDGIFKYKEAFDPESVFSFNVRKIIYCPDTYSDLIQKRVKYENSAGKSWSPRQDFFPEYLS